MPFFNNGYNYILRVVGDPLFLQNRSIPVQNSHLVIDLICLSSAYGNAVLEIEECVGTLQLFRRFDGFHSPWGQQCNKQNNEESLGQAALYFPSKN